MIDGDRAHGLEQTQNSTYGDAKPLLGHRRDEEGGESVGLGGYVPEVHLLFNSRVRDSASRLSASGTGTGGHCSRHLAKRGHVRPPLLTQLMCA